MKIVGALTALLLCTSCVVTSDRIVTAIRDTGFTCDAVNSSEELDPSGSHWRVACTGARAYLASFEPDGRICISPVAYVEAPIAEIELEFQWPLPDVADIRCTPSSSG